MRLKEHVYTRLSGGERQLVLIARALAQEARYLLMDEPAANLDYGNQIKMLQVLQKLSLRGIGVCFTSHHPEHALWCQSEVIAMAGRDVLYIGNAKEVITKEVLEEMYGVPVTIREMSDGAGQERKILIPVF
ncbi:MAG: ABC transporter ATP-binding protein [Muricomes sp.]